MKDKGKKLAGIESSKKLIIYAMNSNLVLKNTYLFNELFKEKAKFPLKSVTSKTLLDHFKNLKLRKKNFRFDTFFNCFIETRKKPSLCKKFCKELIIGSTSFKLPSFNPIDRVVFVTPEYRGVSKAGGISVMVADLCEQLAQLGCEVIIVTPYYYFNKKKAIDYLKTKYLFNIEVRVDKKEIFGIHFMKIKGVKIYLLHNFEIFNSLYQPVSELSY